MDNYITTREYADLNGLSIETVRARCKRGQIPFVKVGGSIMIDRNTPWESRQRGRPRKDSQKSEAAPVSGEIKLTSFLSQMLLCWNYCKNLNDINTAIKENNENWPGLAADNIVSITYDSTLARFVVIWKVECRG